MKKTVKKLRVNLRDQPALEPFETREIEQILQEAYEKSRARQEELLQATYEEAAQIMADAIKQARQEQRAELNKNRQVFTDTILQITREILQQVIPSQVNDILIDDLTTSIWTLGEDDVQRLNTIRGSLEDKSPIIDLNRRRAPLTIEQQSKLYNTFSALADKDGRNNQCMKWNPASSLGVRAHVETLYSITQSSPMWRIYAPRSTKF